MHTILLAVSLCAALAASAGAAAPVDVEQQFRAYLAAPDSLAPAVQSLTTPEAREAFGKAVAEAFDRWPLKPASAFALEASAAVYLIDPDLSAKLLDRACKRLRRGPPSNFERLWHRAAVAALQGPLRSTNKHTRSRLGLEPHVRHARDRFAGDEALLFASATYHERILHDNLHVGGVSMRCLKCESWMMDGIKRDMDRLASVWQELQKQPDRRDEATLRLGLTRYQQRRLDDALALWVDVEKTSNDPSLLYLAALFSGRARHDRGDVAGALQAYSRAHALRPSAQSAMVGLISVYFDTGDITAAETLAVDALMQPDDFGDPWVQYFSGDFHEWRARIALVREAMR